MSVKPMWASGECSDHLHMKHTPPQKTQLAALPEACHSFVGRLDTSIVHLHICVCWCGIITAARIGTWYAWCFPDKIRHLMGQWPCIRPMLEVTSVIPPAMLPFCLHCPPSCAHFDYPHDPCRTPVDSLHIPLIALLWNASSLTAPIVLAAHALTVFISPSLLPIMHYAPTLTTPIILAAHALTVSMSSNKPLDPLLLSSTSYIFL